MKIGRKIQKIKLKSGKIGFFIIDEPKDRRGRTFVYFDEKMDDYILAYEDRLELIPSK
jgi:predicted nucleic acid-binding Zn finger protein